MARGTGTGARTARRSRKADDGSADRWLGTYGDAITLLMAFFVMLYAMAEIDVIKFTAFVAGLEGPFGNPTAAEMLETGPALVGDAGAETPTTDPGAVTASAPAPPTPVPPRDTTAQLEEVRAAIAQSMEAAGVADVARYDIRRRGLTVSIAADDILFPSGSAVLSDQGKRVIRAAAGPLRDAPNEVVVEGHTDDVPLHRGTYTNWNLSTDRAVSVLTLMSSELGLAPQRLAASGYGEFRPRVPNADAAGRSLNRRVDIVVVTLPEEPA